MMRSLNTAATGMVAQQYNLDVISNNLANVNTNAYKQQRAEFQDLMYQTFRASGAADGSSTTPQPVQVGLGSRFSATATNFSRGALSATGNPLDIAINGEGFFAVEKPDGTTAYTRDGAFKKDANGLLVTSDGYPVSPNITIPPTATAISISPAGVVNATVDGSNETQTLGQINVVIFPNPAGLTHLGQNLYGAGGGSGDPQTLVPGQGGAGVLQSEFLEGSNVSVVDEMVKMILAQRSYEINSKAIQTADDMLGLVANLKR